ncbi:hypothetical protein BGW36DRAFT_368798 [Talaromyces proteolyticus]|uniref:Uncharacterized protein n=1 Tax=Talaromyces proteolyticus TaxID=1131652 RepID=A0AAD4KYS6_9EURO|nr:uncharacterized protein BGW36DRAFT_368798 [Talaromyces proteolyticus]KAH8703088.1 hypothetical protein BGW36DRAFT_368798 [Talaromyces proteolyticus]
MAEMARTKSKDLASQSFANHATTDSPKQIIPSGEGPFLMASQLTLDQIQHLLDFEYRPEADIHRWILEEDLEQGSEKEQAGLQGISILAKSRLQRLHDRDCKVLERAEEAADTLLIDRMIAHNQHDPLENIVIAKSDQIFFHSKNSQLEITGFPDRAVGIKTKKGEFFMLLVVRTATPVYFDDALTQLILFLYGSFDALCKLLPDQDKRKTFGFITDAVNFRFALIGPDRVLRLSKKLYWVKDEKVIAAYINYGVKNVLLAGCRATSEL